MYPSDDLAKVALGRGDHRLVARDRGATGPGVPDVVGTDLDLYDISLRHVGDDLGVRAELPEYVGAGEPADCIVGRTHFSGLRHSQGRCAQLWVWRASAMGATWHRVAQSYNRPDLPRCRAGRGRAARAATQQNCACEPSQRVPRQAISPAHTQMLGGQPVRTD